ncbi:hypothetical protein HPB51_027776 [Rhipicephalus microplus]|uniref:Serpin domain-containing protein n=1 Tax=Rhipicephalus microplus TaxID=6941 RepID=A0A9J6CZG5_RHIMP|nr:hypothetical protein HPB51_027776 [Rhipicephalus microplus]
MPKSLSRMIVRFSVDLHRELVRCRRDKRENVTSSPFSIAAALSMTLAGSRGNTGDELLAALRGKDGYLHEHFASFLPKLSSHSHKLQYYFANRIYSGLTFPVAEEYVTFLKSTYVSTIVSVDFEKHSETVRGEINDWVKIVTESKIVDLLAPGSVGPSTGVLLVNAVYFRGLWESPFPACSTSRRDFNVNSRTKVQVDMMSQKQAFAISRNDDLGVRAIEMPYRGGRSSMVVLLPNEIDGLSHLEHHLSHGKLSNILADLKETPDVESIVSNMVHKVYLRVDEDGTDPAVSTPAIAMASSPPKTTMTQKTDFVVDHPFMLLVLKSKSDVVIFISSVRPP